MGWATHFWLVKPFHPAAHHCLRAHGRGAGHAGDCLVGPSCQPLGYFLLSTVADSLGRSARQPISSGCGHWNTGPPVIPCAAAATNPRGTTATPPSFSPVSLLINSPGWGYKPSVVHLSFLVGSPLHTFIRHWRGTRARAAILWGSAAAGDRVNRCFRVLGCLPRGVVRTWASLGRHQFNELSTGVCGIAHQSKLSAAEQPFVVCSAH